MNVLVIYPIYNTIAQTYWDHVESFGKFSKNQVDFYPTNTIIELPIDLNHYDCLILHYGLCLYNQKTTISNALMAKIANYKGLKIYFAQDEYTTPQYAVEKIKQLGIHHIFSCANDEETFRKVYPADILPDLTFSTVFTGYADANPDDSKLRPLEEREFDIVYRGNSLGYCYGSLGAEKFKIGMDFKEVSKKYGLKSDIDWRPNAKIFGEDWTKFLQSGRVMLCTESGSSLTHHDLDIYKKLRETLGISNTTNTWQEFSTQAKDYEKYLVNDGNAVISCVSQKVFEAIECGTVLVCNEGYYSGVIKPDEHYIPLRKDLSNIDDVAKKIKSLPYLNEIRERAYKDIIQSGKYTYQKFIGMVDEKIEELHPKHLVTKSTTKKEDVFKSVVKNIFVSKKHIMLNPLGFVKYCIHRLGIICIVYPQIIVYRTLRLFVTKETIGKIKNILGLK